MSETRADTGNHPGDRVRGDLRCADNGRSGRDGTNTGYGGWGNVSVPSHHRGGDGTNTSDSGRQNLSEQKDSDAWYSTDPGDNARCDIDNARHRNCWYGTDPGDNRCGDVRVPGKHRYWYRTDTDNGRYRRGRSDVDLGCVVPTIGRSGLPVINPGFPVREASLNFGDSRNTGDSRRGDSDVPVTLVGVNGVPVVNPGLAVVDASHVSP